MCNFTSSEKTHNTWEIRISEQGSLFGERNTLFCYARHFCIPANFTFCDDYYIFREYLILWQLSHFVLVLHFALRRLLHFAAILITFSVSIITFCGVTHTPIVQREQKKARTILSLRDLSYQFKNFFLNIFKHFKFGTFCSKIKPFRSKFRTIFAFLNLTMKLTQLRNIDKQ